MLRRLMPLIRRRWHPLWRLRRLSAFRSFQNRFDWTVYTRIPETDLRVAVRLLRDASWIANPDALEPEIRRAFALVLDLLKPAIFWDVGANIGFYSWLVRRHSSIRKVLMFEPDPTNFALITRTIRKNKISDCEVMNVALAERTGETTFLIDKASGATGSLEAMSQIENKFSLHHSYRMTETIPCRTATVDELVAAGSPAPDFMKIDVEGAERLVLAGAQSCLSRKRPTMIIETVNVDLAAELRTNGYAAFCVDEGNLLFIPAESEADLTPFRRAFSPCEKGK
ncbi:MAG: hypothetical protein QOI04_355 [Verrucomicrobiota bacterium]|jgi:FkbM family methyltransferase